MSKLSQPNGDDHPEAAIKHLEDARTLLRDGRYDGSAYHAGYVVECSLKSLIQVERQRQPPLIHKLNDLSQEALRLLALPGSMSAKYVTPTTFALAITDSSHGWRETIRYQPTGAISALVAQGWFQEADSLFKTLLVPMRLDGVL